jgi:UDP-2,3-diacylglucosamine pyrophosphatase LpxH
MIHPDLAKSLGTLASGGKREYELKKRIESRHELIDYAQALFESGHSDAFIHGHTHVPRYRRMKSGTYMDIGEFNNYFTFGIVDCRSIRLMSLADGMIVEYEDKNRWSDRCLQRFENGF